MSVKLATRLIEPDYWTGPGGSQWRPEKVQTLGPEVCDVLAGAGFAPDPQQELLHDMTFAVNPAGLPLAFAVGGVATRQNVKTGWLIGAIIGFIEVLEIPEVMYTAHKMDTAHDAQSTLARIMLESPLLRRRMLPQKDHGIVESPSAAHIQLRNGQKIHFKTRTNDGGRGLARMRVLLDEFFAATPAQVGSLIPTMGAQRGAGQLLYASSAPKPESELLLDLMKRGRAGTSPRLAYAEWRAPFEPCRELVWDPEAGQQVEKVKADCAHPKDAAAAGVDCALDRESLMLHANPAAVNTDRMSLQTILDFRQELPPEEFARECLGWGADPEDEDADTFGPGRWKACASSLPLPEHPAAIGVALNLDETTASIAAAGLVETEDEDLVDEAGDPLEVPIVGAVVELDDTGQALVDEVKRIQDVHDCVVLMDEKGPGAERLLKAFDDADVAVETVTLEEYAESCSQIFTKVRGRLVLHTNHPLLNRAVGGAEWRYVGDRRVWGRKQSTRSVAMLEAATLAVKGAEDFGAGIW